MRTISEIYSYFLQCQGVSTDTRQIKENSLFVALKGSNFNGNVFAKEALDRGAKYVLIDEADYQIHERTILVDNALTALQDLANFHRKQFQIPFIAITGTNGKTTTKELVNVVLSTSFVTKATQGNLNNHIGVPLTLLGINNTHQIAVIEMGANHVGDIQELCKIAEPNFGLITNIGQAHLEGFGNFEGVLRAKSELYDHLLRGKGVAFINAQNPILQNMGKRFERSEQAKVTYYGAENSFYFAELIEANPYISYKSEVGERVNTQLLGGYNFDNILSALCIGKYFGVDMRLAHGAIAHYAPSNNRSQVIKGERNTLILDAYNANPSSMKAALENFEKIPTNRKIVVLGDMFELGMYSKEKHREIIELVKTIPLEQAIFCGKDFYNLNDEFSSPHFHFFENKENLKEYLQNYPIKDSYLLVKGSRGMGLESLLDLLK
jgi:UDP-N-acetylmuramoyl-tripeptide--D-alanyl-D-alanine ligase